MEEKIKAVFEKVFLREVPGADPPEINRDTILLDSGLDSIGLAVFVLELEEQLGFDPFTLAEEPFYPGTFGEFVQFYHENKPSTDNS